MELVKPGVNYNAIGKTIEDYVKAEGLYFTSYLERGG
jgi:hypothetical protein